jgi:hypothetical protein
LTSQICGAIKMKHRLTIDVGLSIEDDDLSQRAFTDLVLVESEFEDRLRDAIMMSLSQLFRSIKVEDIQIY